MSSRDKRPSQQQAEQFTNNCRYLKLNLLAEEYRQMVDNANEKETGYFEFICVFDLKCRQQSYI